MTKNMNLKLFTKTWPARREKKTKEDNGRPLTATLEKPTILDIKFISKIDMSRVRKEFLNITYLCRLPLIIKEKKNVNNRPSSLLNVDTRKSKKKKADLSEDSHEDDESSVIQSAKINRIKSRCQQHNNNSVIQPLKRSAMTRTLNDANNNKMLRVPSRKRTLASSASLNTVTNPLLNEFRSSSTKLPEPCRTCGRPNQPERFHSHPTTPMQLTPRKRAPVDVIREVKEPQKPFVKSTVQKPVAIKYTSRHGAANKPQISPLKKTPLGQANNNQKTSRLNAPSPVMSPNKSTARSRESSGKRTLTCYICAREFGTASLPLHEPKCLEKWERENAKLPPNLRRKTPVKPDGPVNSKEYNQLAWESSQANLVPCNNCGRTFFPDRLVVHQRSCKTPQSNKRCSSNDTSSATSPAMSQVPPSTVRQPPSVQCYICGRLFGKHSIEIHERQCLKKWHMENESLPPDMRSPPPTKNGKKPDITQAEQQTSANKNKNEIKEEKTTSGAKSPLFPCYLCGKLFTVNSIYIHEPQCLKMWKIENEKLPPERRRPQPLKPDIKFTRSGKFNLEEMAESNWQSHLNQLVACKLCSRTFNPDRVEVHERSCKGN